jgi:hypothetical protein
MYENIRLKFKIDVFLFFVFLILKTEYNLLHLNKFKKLFNIHCNVNNLK